MKYHETRIRVRFNEVDSYRVAWHGNYVSWMEVGRNELAGLFELNADQVHSLGYLAPVVDLHLKYRKPSLFNEDLKVRTSVKRTETATMEFVCEICGPDDSLRATGRCVLALTDLDGILQFTIPPVISERIDRLLAYLEV
jgi:acyl-CoA thioester hydrolase